ncbi:MAG TPA: hypothetical protein VEB19_06500 [Gemmatimonadaceae bacterium]|nr:hypothetical protein [Gemmatimonadaceae bacterium]
MGNRDSLGTIAAAAPTTVTWSVDNPLIATVNTNGVVTALTTGATWLRVASNATPTNRDSVPLVVTLPPLNSCTGQGGTLYPSQTIAAARVWSAQTNPHYVAGTLTFSATGSLTIEKGVLVCLSSGASMNFQAGSELIARGTPDSLIRFLPTVADQPWGGITFGTNIGYSGVSTDTSIITNALFERAGSAISGQQQHALVMDSVHFRQFQTVGVRVQGPGSRLSRSVIDTVGANGGGAFAVTLGRGTVEATTIRPGPTGAGIAPTEPGLVQDVSITGGTTGIGQSAALSGLRLINVTITGSLGTGLDLTNAQIDPGSSNVQVSGALYGYRGGLGNLAILWPDSVTQGALLANTRDTVFLTTGSTIRNRTLTLRPDLRFVVLNEIVVDTQGVLNLRPGTRMAFQNAGIRVTNSGRLNARGTAAAPILFVPRPGQTFYGFVFENPQIPAGGFTPQPRDTSYLTNVRVDSAGNGYCGIGACGAVNTYDRHMVVIDSATFRYAFNAAVALNTSGSRISRSLIDTTGNPTSSYPALYLGGGTLAESLTVRRSGQNGIAVGGAVTDSVRLRGVRIEDSEGVGLLAEGARIVGDSGSVTSIANAYGYRGYIDSWAALARDSIAQLNFLGNSDNRVEIVGRSDRRFVGRPGRIDSLRVIPQLPWMVINDMYVDTLARLVPSPGSRVGFWSGYIHFTRGGQLHSRGTATAPVVLEKWSASSGIFNGIQFANRGGTGRDTSVLINTHVRTIESCLSGSLGCATLATQDRHVLIVDSSSVDQSTYTAVSLAAHGSRISRSIIDNSGQPTSYAGLELGRGTLAETTTVRNSRGTGVIVGGSITEPTDTIRLRGLTILNSGGVALHAEGGRIVGDSGSVVATGNGYAFRGFIDNFAVLARDSIAQLNFLGNVSDRVEIVGRSDRRFSGRSGRIDSLRVIPQLPWMVINDMYVDTLARLVPSPGSRIGFWSGYIHFTRGGQLHARGTPAQPIVLEKWSETSGIFNGLQFANSGGTGLDTSYVINAQIRNVESCLGGTLGCAAVATQDRHVLIVDSTRVDSTTYTAISLAAHGSRISRSVLDLVGQPTTYAGLEIGRGTLAESTTVRRARGTGVLVSGSITIATDTIRLRGLTIQNSGGVGLHAEGGRIVGDSGSVTATGNAYPFRGYVDNFAVLAKDSIAQLNLLGNTEDRVEIVGRSDRPFAGRAGRLDTLKVIPQLPWLAINDIHIDTLARLVAGPGGRIGFWSGSLHFRQGGRMTAHGSAANKVILERWSAAAGNFNGISFANAGGTGVDTSSFINTIVRNSQSCQSSPLGCAVLAPQNRHVLVMDSTELSQHTYTAVALSAPGSHLTRSLVDVAGQPTSYAGVEMGPRTRLDSTTVQNARGTGVLIGGSVATVTDTIRLHAVSILNSGGAGLHAEGGRLLLDTGTVTLTGNAYPFYGYIDNLAALARDSVHLARFLGNADNVAYIIGRSDRPLVGDPLTDQLETPLELTAIPQLRYEFRQMSHVDTLARFAPRPGARLTFENGGLTFQRGGHMQAVGTSTNVISFAPSRAGVNFYGLQFDNPGAYSDPISPPHPVAQSTLAYVRVDSSSGQISGQTAVNGDSRHRLDISDAHFRRSLSGAIRLVAPHSTISRVRVDTTGNPTTTIAAVALDDSMVVDDLHIYRSGQIGIYTLGRGISFNNVRVTRSLHVGLYIDGDNLAGSENSSFSQFTADSNALGGVMILVDTVQLSSCVIRGNGTAATHHGIATSGNRREVVISNCDLVDNAGNGVNNGNTTDGTFLINASTNWWGNAAGAAAGDGVSANASVDAPCSTSCLVTSAPIGSGMPPAPAMPARASGERPARPRRRRRPYTM